MCWPKVEYYSRKVRQPEIAVNLARASPRKPCWDAATQPAPASFLASMHGKPDLQTVILCLSRLEGQIADQRRLIDVLRELGDIPEAEKAALRLTRLEESFDAVFLYRKLLEEELSQQRRMH